MSYGPTDFQDDILRNVRAQRIKGLPRGRGEWRSDDHEQAAWVVMRALDERVQAIKDRKALAKALAKANAERAGLIAALHDMTGAARSVVSNWERGDLAAAVNNLESAEDSASALLKKLRGAR